MDSIIRDLVDISVKMTREHAMEKVQSQAVELAEERILDILVPPSSPQRICGKTRRKTSENKESAARQLFRKKLREGELDDREIEIEIAGGAYLGNHGSSGHGRNDWPIAKHDGKYRQQKNQNPAHDRKSCVKIFAGRRSGEIGQ